MDLVAGIKFLENRLGGRKPNHGKGKSARKDSPNDKADGKNAQTGTAPAPAEDGAKLGRKIDIVV